MSDKGYIKRLKCGPELAQARDRYAAGDFMGCVDILHKVLIRHPETAIAYFIMGLCFEAINEPFRALDLFSRSVKIKPNNAEAWYNKGVTEAWLGRFADARASYERALKIDPRLSGAWTNLGNVLMAEGKHDDAIRAYDRSASISTNRPEAIHNRSFVHLLRGNWVEGWRDYEARWGLPGAYHANPQPPGVPKWTGEPLEGKTLLVLQEQGSGDTFQMLRYVPGLLFQGATVILRVPGPMMRLVRHNFPQCAVEEYVHPDSGRPQTPWPACDYVVPFMSLPGIFGTMPDTVPFSDGPYLIPPTYGPQLAPREGFKVGFAWKGSSQHKNDRNRSTGLKQWLPLLSIPGIAWYSLQQEVTEPERLTLGQIPSVDQVQGLTDWADTAHVLGQLDALVSVDTGLVHLAGAMGVVTSVFIAATPDFRWLLAPRRDTPWYKSVLLCRQPTHGDWTTPFTEVAARLRAIVHYQERAA